jgi:GAF domain-containing protein
VKHPAKARERAGALVDKLRAAPSLIRVLAELADGLIELLDLSAAGIFLVDEEQEHLHARMGKPESFFPMGTKVTIGLDDTSAASVRSLRTKAPEVITHAKKDPAAKAWLVRMFGVESYATLPMLVGDRPVGSIILIEARRVRQFEPLEVEVAQWVADEAAGLIAAYDRG